MVCASSGTWRGKTLSSSGDLLREIQIASAPLAAELVRLKVDVIVSGGTSSTRTRQEATTPIPIVMAQDSDPVGNGFVASLARPGANVTGLATLSPELGGKRLEIFERGHP